MNIFPSYRLPLFFLFLLSGLSGIAPSCLAQEAPDCKYIRGIYIDGPRRTKDWVIHREISLAEGQCLDEKSIPEAIALNRGRLMNLKLFSDVKIDILSVGTDSLDVEIRVWDRFPIMPEFEFEFADRNFNVWWTEQNHDLGRLNLGLSLTHNNFRGNREVVSVLGQVGYTQKVGFSYSRPFVDKGQRHGFGFSIFGMQNREIAYATVNDKLAFFKSDHQFMQRKLDAAIWYTFRPAYAVHHQFQLSFHNYWISDTIFRLNPAYLDNGEQELQVLQFNYRFDYNGVDNWNYPLRGQRFIGTLSHKVGLSGGQWQASMGLQYDRYWAPLPKWYASLVGRGKASVPQRQQPYIFLQNLGYDYNYVRGYEYYVVDGTMFGLIRASLKRELLNVDIRLPIRYFELVPLRVYGKAYADCGASYHANAPYDILNNRLLYSAGLGIDIVTLYDIKVRIEYTINHLNEKSIYLHRSGE